MKYPCNVIKDLLPLYCDSVCSKESEAAVSEHIGECESCRGIYEEMKNTAIDNIAGMEQYQKQQQASVTAVGKKLKTKHVWLIAVGVAAGVVFLTAVLTVLMFAGILGISLVVTGEKENMSVWSTDITEYSRFFGDYIEPPCDNRWEMDETIFPPEITDDMTVNDFMFTYSNLWDAEYASVLDITYTEKDFENELKRLHSKENEEFSGLYGAVAAPDGYEIAAMDSDEYYGFVYAMIPTDGSTNVRYVMTVFCNYFMDDDLLDEIPEGYLLDGMDISVENDYRQEHLD